MTTIQQISPATADSPETGPDLDNPEYIALLERAAVNSGRSMDYWLDLMAGFDIKTVKLFADRVTPQLCRSAGENAQSVETPISIRFSKWFLLGHALDNWSDLSESADTKVAEKIWAIEDECLTFEPLTPLDVWRVVVMDQQGPEDAQAKIRSRLIRLARRGLGMDPNSVGR